MYDNRLNIHSYHHLFLIEKNSAKGVKRFHNMIMHIVRLLYTHITEV